LLSRRRRPRRARKEDAAVSENESPSGRLEDRLRVFDEGNLTPEEATELFQHLVDTGQIDEVPDRYKEVAREFERRGRISFPEDERE
jgi:hypothetical protein